MAITATQRTEIVKVVVGLFDGAPGSVYLNEFSGYAGNPAALVNDLVSTSAFQGIYPAYLTSLEFGTQFVEALVGDAAAAADKAWAANWIAGMLDAGSSRGEVAYTAISALEAAAGNANWGAAATQFANKVKVAEYYSVNMAGSATDVATLQGVISNVTDTTDVSSDAALEAAATENPAVNVGQTFTLTTGADTVVGTAANDTINALSIKADGTPGTTFSGFDVIDGAAGEDTLNIYTTAADNNAFPNNASVKNVETVNIYNSLAAAALGDASKYEGVKVLNQVGANADAVTNLATGTTAGFNSTTQATIAVQAAVAAETAAIALTDVSENTATLNVTAAAGGVLNSVTVSGNRVDTNKNGVIPALALNVTAGKNVESASVNTATNVTLTVANEAGSTKVVSAVDASASTGAVTYNAANTVATVKTGSGADNATINFVGTTTANAAALSTGAGNDTLTVNVAQGAATAVTADVDAGEGNDTVNLNVVAGVTYDVKAGAGDDIVVIAGTVKTTDKVDGGDGADTVSMASKGTYVADDYIVLNKVLTGFEALQLTGAAATIDAAQLAANYSTLDLSAASVVDNVGSQALIANGNLNVEASGYKSDAENSLNGIVHAGSVAVTEKVSGTVQAHADSVNLTVAGGKGNAVAANNTILTGEVKSATVALTVGTDTKGTTDTTDDTAVASTITVIARAAANDVLKDLASLTLTGNGAATVTNIKGSSLVTVDASALAAADLTGKATAGLTYISANAEAETVKLGAGLDTVRLTDSTYGKMDTVEGLNLVLNAAGTALDVTSDVIVIPGSVLAANGKFTTTQTDLDLALKDAAAFQVGGADVNSVVFQLGGNTYFYQDANADNLVDATDTVVKFVGLLDLDALVVAL